MSSPEELGALRLLVDTAFGMGGLSTEWGLEVAEKDGEAVLLFCERTPQGLLPLAELHPVRDGYRNLP